MRTRLADPHKVVARSLTYQQSESLVGLLPGAPICACGFLDVVAAIILLVVFNNSSFNMTDAGPVTKKKRVAEASTAAGSSSTARLFAPFRALGFISDHVPFAMQVRSAPGALNGPSVQIVSCLGRSWAMWEAGKMNLLFVGTLLELDKWC